jgi:hypothetical protein
MKPAKQLLYPGVKANVLFFDKKHAAKTRDPYNLLSHMHMRQKVVRWFDEVASVPGGINLGVAFHD